MPDIIINGPEGRLEARYTHGTGKNPPVSLVLHPHPLHGGTMNNKIVYSTYHAFANHGFSVLRINFRGVGRSQGKFDSGIGELADAACAMDWLQLNNPQSTVFWVSGFSFGAWIAMQLLMRRPEIQGFVAISPPVNKCDFSFLAPCPAPGLIVQGDADSVVSEEAVAKLVAKLGKQRNSEVEYAMVEGADHFYRTKMDILNETVSSYITDRLMALDKPRKIKHDKRRRPLPSEE